VTTFPRQGPVERYAQLRAVLDKASFLDEFPGVGVLIRLDERGGDDEPAPWAFHGSGLPLPVDIPSTDEDVFLDRTQERSIALGADESTVTGPTFQLSIPAARGRATLHVVPRQNEVTLGRDPKAGIAIAERSVSKRHARILVDLAGTTPRFFLVDESTHGTSINGRKAAPGARTPLESGDVVDLSDVSLLFLDVAALWDGLLRLTGG
jgi:hypothetical protein